MIKRKNLSSCIVAAFIISIIFSTVPLGSYYAATLSDVQGHWAAPAIQKMVDHRK